VPIVLAITMLVFARNGAHLLSYNFFCDRSKEFTEIELDESKTYIIDEYVIRHPLQWNFPKKWKIAPDFNTTNARLLDKPEAEIWILSLKNLAYFYPELYSQEKLKMGNKEFTNLPVEFWEYIQIL